MDLRVRQLTDLSGVTAAHWDALEHGPSPFLEHGFLRALELSGSVGAQSGWDPVYLVAESGSQLLGAVCAFVKHHSYGEYVFGFAWARASERGGLPYYPKMVVAAPVTPVSGNRILLSPGLGETDAATVVAALVEATRAAADERGCSSVHWLFTTAGEQDELIGHGYHPRASFQYHWENAGYASFDDFLGRLTSRRRKQIRKERRRAQGLVDEISMFEGSELSEQQLEDLDFYYRRTAAVRGGTPYLQRGFFGELCARSPDRIRYAQASREGRSVAGALFLATPGGLFGRYWGCREELDCLHFELAYYVGIDYCIRHRLPRFEAGAQGEHKLLRGFMPSPTFSSHWIRHPGLERGVREFLAVEAQEVGHHMTGLAEYGPYRQGGTTPAAPAFQIRRDEAKERDDA